MRRTVTVVALLVVMCVFAAESAVGEGPGISLAPASPTPNMTLVRHEYPGPCGDAAAILEFRQSVLGDMAPPGYQADPSADFSGPRCDLECLPCSYVENEPWCETDFVDTYNGGCNSTPYVFETILPSYGTITVCGTSGNYLYGGSTYRDTDFYEIVLTQETSLTWTCVAEFPLATILVDGTGGCAAYVILEFLETPECEESVISASLPPGTYWLFVATSVYSGVPCGSDYIMTIEGFEAAPDCAAGCPPGSFVEGEPLCFPDYYDGHNGGCNSSPYVFQYLEPDPYIVLCGEMGVYPYYGFCNRDTDWYEFVLDEPRRVEFCIMAGFDYQLIIIQSIAGCDGFNILYTLTGPPCDVACEAYDLEAGTYWLWVGSWSWLPVDCGRSYVVTIDGYTTPVEETTWGSVKALYR